MLNPVVEVYIDAVCIHNFAPHFLRRRSANCRSGLSNGLTAKLYFMSINMTQDFEFETDDRESLMKMLDTIGSILFDGTKIVVSQDAKDFDYCFDDGKYDHNSYSVFDKSVIEHSKIELGVKIYKEKDSFNNRKEAIEHAAGMNREIVKTPTRKFIMGISTDYSRYKIGKSYASFKSGKKYIESAVEKLLDDPDLE